MRISDWSSDVCSSDLNTTAGIPEPLLSRLRIERVGGPGPEHFEAVLESILRDAAAELGVAPMLLPPLEPEVIGWLRTAFTRTGDVRRLRRAGTTAPATRAGPATRGVPLEPPRREPLDTAGGRLSGNTTQPH